jgi:NAD(P)-dependent dehydrogenase (short-subunit alcohol dehydrogenase family)
MPELKALSLGELGSIYSMFSLKGKSALVTGAAGGIGRSTANAFAEMGANVALMDIPAREDVIKANAEFIGKKHGVKAIALTGDVSDDKSVKDFVEKAAAEFGSLHVVHANAGIARGANGSDISDEDWQRILGVNLTGVLYVSRAVANIMKRDNHGGSIIMTASMSGIIVNRAPDGARYGPGYTATKAAVRHLAKTMAMDYVTQNIRVNSISPGIILSGLHDGWGEGFFESAPKDVPMKRFGSLDEIVGIVAYLASDLATYTTGSDFVVDGGYTIW